MFILQGPEDDEEPESDLSVTELKQLRQERLAAAEAERAQAESEEEERVKKEEERGIDWGMGGYKYNYRMARLLQYFFVFQAFISGHSFNTLYILVKNGFIQK